MVILHPSHFTNNDFDTQNSRGAAIDVALSRIYLLRVGVAKPSYENILEYVLVLP